MLRLFGTAGLLTVVSAALAVGTNSAFYQTSTVILGSSLGLLYWWLQRGMPPRRGSLQLKGLKETVEVFRDEHGVPHIYAKNLHDLYMAQGYVTAQDRLWSMDLGRRTASGQLAEILGSKLLPLDRHFRDIGLRRAAEESFKTYTPTAVNLLEAYAAGVNARIAEGTLPPEFDVLRYQPELWSAVDTLCIGKYMSYQMGNSWAGGVFRARLVQTVGAEKAAELFWNKPDLEQLAELEGISLPDVDSLMTTTAEILQEAGGVTGWVVGGAGTRSGVPLLANAPQLGVNSPLLWYEAHLAGSLGLDVTGATLPGIPGVLIGENREIAWGITGGHVEAQDLFVEKLNPEVKEEYLYQGAWERGSFIREEIHVLGLKTPVVHRVMVTRHGPVIARGPETGLAFRWSGLEPTAELETILAINRAQSWPEFRRALEPVRSPGQFIFAGKDGTIACRLGGAIPVRSRGDGQVAVPGWTGEYEWTGIIPFEELPEVINPPEAFIVPENPEAAGYQAQRIAERLRGSPLLTAERMREIQMDWFNLQARSLLQILLNAVQEGLRQGAHPETLNQVEKTALLLLSGWDCEEAPSSQAPAVWHQWYLFLLEGIFRPQMGLALFDQFVSCGRAMQIADRMLKRVAEGDESRWLGREGEEGLNRIALRSFRRAVALVAAKQGRRPERWRWDREHRVLLENPLARRFSALKQILSLGPYPAGGSTTTVFTQTYSQLHPFEVTVTAPWRQVVDLGAPDESWYVCAPGQGGHPLSPYYEDQVAMWLRGELTRRLHKQDTIRNLPRLVLHPDSEPAPTTRSPVEPGH